MRESKLGSYIRSSRQRGHTTLAIEGAKTYDRKFLVIAHNHDYAKLIAKLCKNENAVPMSVQSSKLRTMSDLPAIVDNSAVLATVESYEKQISMLETALREKNVKIRDLSYRIGFLKGGLYDLKDKLRLLSWWRVVFNFNDFKQEFARSIKNSLINEKRS